MPVLTTQQRNTLESAVKLARKLAETGARNALQALAVNNPEPFAHMSAEQRALRNRLRNKARLLGDELPATGHQQIDHLSYELAYENWHKMLFAKFLEANGLLMHTSGVAVTMEECEELAKEEGFADKWEASAAYASKMLPAIFRPEDPVMQVYFASNDRIRLEEVLDGLDNYIFTADDALGWVYQYWQSEAKKQIEEEEKSGQKVDGNRLPAKTQLFTEHYMVQSLVDNTIGAWWISRNKLVAPPIKFDYLRLIEITSPAAGYFSHWPDKTKDITCLDPCMGSGHFLVSLFNVFVKLRMYEENLSKEDATDKVLTENLHGLELDARCTQIAVFNLALTAWKFCGYYRSLPEMSLACSGLTPKGKITDWIKLIGNVPDTVLKSRMEKGVKILYEHFQLAPELGSLLDPNTINTDAFTASFEELRPTLIKALREEEDKDLKERGVMAAGIAKAGHLLSKRYTLQITNVPYLSRGKQGKTLSEYTLKKYPDSKNDLATVFLDKMLNTTSSSGTVCVVIPQNWLFTTPYKKFRERLLKSKTWNHIIKLGSKSFQTPMWDFNVMLFMISNIQPSKTHNITGLDVSNFQNATLKAKALVEEDIKTVNQSAQLNNPDKRIILDSTSDSALLENYAYHNLGISTGDSIRFYKKFWELSNLHEKWSFIQGTVSESCDFGGCDNILLWENGKGELFDYVVQKIGEDQVGSWLRGRNAWNRNGILVSSMNHLPITQYLGGLFDENTVVVTPTQPSDLLPIWSFCFSDNFNTEVRKANQKLNVRGDLVKVPFDLNYWNSKAELEYPGGLPKPYSNDATQWLFHGHPAKAENPLHVALARLLGYRWPAENDTEMELADEARKLIKQIKTFDNLTDEDGILCIPPVNGELAASERLRSYLRSVYDSEWSNNTIGQLLQKEDTTASSLEDWLRTSFFDQHCKLFQNRPFIWHIWDGRKDGFSALVNYHKLNKEALQRLIFTYLGDWIRQCEAKRKSGESGAEGLLSAALKLKEKLEAILEGEAPYDIFVRWKPLEGQPIGWEPDLNDGVRLNIRPLITADVLRKKPNIKWGVDRGKNPPGFYWGEIRDNDKHLSLEEKRKAT
jgi:hypothetical protein